MLVHLNCGQDFGILFDCFKKMFLNKIIVVWGNQIGNISYARIRALKARPIYHFVTTLQVSLPPSHGADRKREQQQQQRQRQRQRQEQHKLPSWVPCEPTDAILSSGNVKSGGGGPSSGNNDDPTTDGDGGDSAAAAKDLKAVASTNYGNQAVETPMKEDVDHPVQKKPMEISRS